METVSKRQIGIDARRATKSGRFYNIDKTEPPYISATNVLDAISKPALYNWYAKQEREMCLEVFADWYFDRYENPIIQDRAVFIKSIEGIIGKEKKGKRELEKAGDIGTQIHSLIEWTNRGLLALKRGKRPEVCDEAEWGFMAYEDKAKEIELEPMYVEQVVFSRKFKYAGTLDLIARVLWRGEKAITIIDFKSGKAIYGEAKCQAAAYFQAVVEMCLANPQIALILRLPKIIGDPEPELQQVDNLSYHFEAFLHAAALREWQILQEEEYREKQKQSK